MRHVKSSRPQMVLGPLEVQVYCILLSYMQSKLYFGAFVVCNLYHFIFLFLTSIFFCHLKFFLRAALLRSRVFWRPTPPGTWILALYTCVEPCFQNIPLSRFAFPEKTLSNRAISGDFCTLFYPLKKIFWGSAYDGTHPLIESKKGPFY